LPLLVIGLVILYWLSIGAWALVAWTFRPAPSPDPIAAAKAKAQEEEAKKVASLRNCLPADARVTPFGPRVTVDIPASNSPTWGFVGIWPPRTGYVHAHAYLQGRAPLGSQFYLVDQDLHDDSGKPLPTTALEQEIVEGERKITPVVRLGRLRYDGNLGDNKSDELSVWYMQSSVTGVHQTVTMDFELPFADETKQLLVEVGRKEVVLDLPSLGFDWVWVVPIRGDSQYESRIGKDVVPASGVVAATWEKDYSLILPLPGEKKATKVFANLPYQALTMWIDDEEPAVQDRHWVASTSEAGGKKIHLQLNADPEDLLAPVCKPAKVLIGWRKTPDLWGWKK
jgi:hypothetical protein